MVVLIMNTDEEAKIQRHKVAALTSGSWSAAAWGAETQGPGPQPGK